MSPEASCAAAAAATSKTVVVSAAVRPDMSYEGVRSISMSACTPDFIDISHVARLSATAEVKQPTMTACWRVDSGMLRAVEKRYTEVGHPMSAIITMTNSTARI